MLYFVCEVDDSDQPLRIPKTPDGFILHPFSQHHLADAVRKHYTHRHSPKRRFKTLDMTAVVQHINLATLLEQSNEPVV
jgi:hypothetical protein